MNEARLQCVSCKKEYALDTIQVRCDCDGLLQVIHPQGTALTAAMLDQRLLSQDIADRSGVWRFREQVAPLPEASRVSLQEGRTGLYRSPKLCHWAQHELLEFKHEGENLTGSFKDRGMTVAVSQAKHLGQNLLACASTGNTSAALAAYAAHGGMTALIFVPKGKVSLNKLTQAFAYGARCVEVDGDFDVAMQHVVEAAERRLVYLVNSLNPFRLEGQKTIIWDMLQQRSWQAPDWIVVPGGNLGNTSAFGKALREAHANGWITKQPKIAVVQAEGASPFFKSFQQQFSNFSPMQANTIASAIQIGNPVNFSKAKDAVTSTQGLVYAVPDEAIMTAKQQIDAAGIGCEPASACTLAGVRDLRHQQIIKEHEEVVCVLTGHLLKDTDTTYQHLQTQGRTQVISYQGDMDALLASL